MKKQVGSTLASTGGNLHIVLGECIWRILRKSAKKQKTSIEFFYINNNSYV